MSAGPHWLDALVLVTRCLSGERARELLEGLSESARAAAGDVLRALAKLGAVDLRLHVVDLLGPTPDRAALTRRLARIPSELRAVALRSLWQAEPAPHAPARETVGPSVRWGQRLARELRGARRHGSARPAGGDRPSPGEDAARPDRSGRGAWPAS
jgi:hypothetical protein